MVEEERGEADEEKRILAEEMDGEGKIGKREELVEREKESKGKKTKVAGGEERK